VGDILDRAMRQPPERRLRFIECLCRGNAAMQREVCSLLPHYERAGAFEAEHERTTQWTAWTPGHVTVGGLGVTLGDDVMLEAERKIPFCVDQLRVSEVLGRGGMGIVYRAEHPTLLCSFAVKMPRRELADPMDRRRFALEVEILRSLHHDGIARMVYSGECAQRDRSQPFIVMEYVDGQPLTRHARERELDTERKLALLADICDAVEYAHARGIVHGDLKPANILVDDEDRPKLVDFGIAKIENLWSSLVHDAEGRFIGTPDYASPEQLSGRFDRIGPGADVYALGLIAHQLLTGKLPKYAQGKWQLDLTDVRPPRRPSKRGNRDAEFVFYLNRILLAALVRDPASRTCTAGELGRTFEDLNCRFGEPPRRSTLDRLLRRAPQGAAGKPDPLKRPRKAVLRTRIRSSLDHGRY
jgi:serine/threonine protein kinase